jgi:SnoaL-like domain
MSRTGMCDRLAMLRRTDRRTQRLRQHPGSLSANTGRWNFDVHRLVAEGDVVVSEVTVTDAQQSARVVAFSELEGGEIARQIEYWPVSYDPPPGREDLTRPIDRVP